MGIGLSIKNVNTNQLLTNLVALILKFSDPGRGIVDDVRTMFQQKSEYIYILDLKIV